MRRLGQHFLKDKKVLKKIIDSADLKPNDLVLEIGAGTGVLTRELAKKVKKVIAVEKDPKLIPILNENLKDFDNIEIIQADILRLDPKPYTLKLYKIVANLPYYIVAPVIRMFLECSAPRPRCMILMVQKEVGQRICAKPPHMNLLAVSVQFYAQPKILFYVSKKAFRPQPKVDGAVIKIIPRTRAALVPLFFEVVKAGFSQPRKQLVNNLSKKLKLDKEKVGKWLKKNGIHPTQRAETLSIEDWIKLAKTVKIK